MSQLTELSVKTKETSDKPTPPRTPKPSPPTWPAILFGLLLCANPVLAESTPVRIHRVSHDASDRAPLLATGTLVASEQVPIAFAVEGVVASILVDEGAAVNRGDALARLDRVPFQSAVDQAESRRLYLEKSLARSQTLLDANALSPEEYDAQQAELRAVEAQLKLARWRLSRATLTAPFDARVAGKKIERGQVVSGATPGFDLVNVATLELRVSIPSRLLPDLDLDAKFRITSDDRPGQTWEGSVHHRPFVSDARSGTVPLLLEIPNRDERLLPGMTAQCEIPLAGRTALEVPLSALRVQDDGTTVFRIENGIAREVHVEVGTVRGDAVSLLAGLTAGDVIVASAPDRLRDGDAVQPAE